MEPSPEAVPICTMCNVIGKVAYHGVSLGGMAEAG